MDTNFIESNPCCVGEKNLANFCLQTKKLQTQMLTYSSSKFGAISGNFKLWPQIYLERMDILKIDNKLDQLPSLPRWTKKFRELWSTNKQVAGVTLLPGKFYPPPWINPSSDLRRRAASCWALPHISTLPLECTKQLFLRKIIKIVATKISYNAPNSISAGALRQTHWRSLTLPQTP